MANRTATKLSDTQPPTLSDDQHDSLKDHVEALVHAALAPHLEQLAALLARLEGVAPEAAAADEPKVQEPAQN